MYNSKRNVVIIKIRIKLKLLAYNNNLTKIWRKQQNFDKIRKRLHMVLSLGVPSKISVWPGWNQGLDSMTGHYLFWKKTAKVFKKHLQKKQLVTLYFWRVHKLRVRKVLSILKGLLYLETWIFTQKSLLGVQLVGRGVTKNYQKTSTVSTKDKGNILDT